MQTRSQLPPMTAWFNDEGFSEGDPGSDTRKPSDGATDSGLLLGPLPASESLPDWVTNMSEAQRSDFAYAVLRSLRTSSITAIVRRLEPLLHIDPVLRLPSEITAEILSYLDLSSLLCVSALSKTWRAHALVSTHWRNLFTSEGWILNIPKVRDFEKVQQRREAGKRGKGKAPTRLTNGLSDAESRPLDGKAQQMNPSNFDHDAVMVATDRTRIQSPTQWGKRQNAVRDNSNGSIEDMGNENDTAFAQLNPLSSVNSIPSHSSSSNRSLSPPIKPCLLISDLGQTPTLNWHYLYKQKRRLEDNWLAGRFINFRLPHPDHQDEAHAECIYTVQYSGKYLVSGSRDKTLRIWNLDSQRLALPPLLGHDASVLCLQFDASPEQDIIISGGSDCHVIIWRLSTGKMIKKLKRAHSESVLNLRFDKKYLITCSKDKTIKVWNRGALLPTDSAHPNMGHSGSARFPFYIISSNILGDPTKMELQPLPAYSLLMTLHGHTAAVNAVQILDGQIVSASGDRHIKLWDIKTGKCLRAIAGHQKGIACVQFDGRRIVSGSSDETIRIFDGLSGAEVACLRGHADLVRTVQARFSDVPGHQLEEEAEAHAIDHTFLKASLSGAISPDLTRDQRRMRNAGGRDPTDIFAYGAKLPPGGGGSRWARIVSGSYDETIIIWKRDSKGKWTPAHQLTQSEAIIRAGGEPRPTQGNRHQHRHGDRTQRQANSSGVATDHEAIHQTVASTNQIQIASQVPAVTTTVDPNSRTANLSGRSSSVTISSKASSVGALKQGLSNRQAAFGYSPQTSEACHHPQTKTRGKSYTMLADQHNTQQRLATYSSSLLSRNTELPPTKISTNITSSLARTPVGDPALNPYQSQTLHPFASQSTETESHTPRPRQPFIQHPSALSHSGQSIPRHTFELRPNTTQDARAGSPSRHRESNTTSSAATTSHHATNSLQHPLHAQPLLVAAPAGVAASLGSVSVGGAPVAQYPHCQRHHRGLAQPSPTNARVYKLQFDNRRIICSSPEPIIVGWDFANGDIEIESASPFFGDPE